MVTNAGSPFVQQLKPAMAWRETLWCHLEPLETPRDVKALAQRVTPRVALEAS